MANLFTTLLYQPIFNLFVGLYDIIPDIGIIIFLVTVGIKLALHPLTHKSIVAQKVQMELQPKLEKIKAEHKGDQQRIAQETMALYKEHKINPLGSCLPMLIQLPIFIALYYVLRGMFGVGGEPHFDLLYSFVAQPESINPVSLGIFNLANTSIVLAVLAAGTQFFSAKLMQMKRAPKVAGDAGKDESMAAMMNKQMLYFMPLMTLLIGLKFPGGLTLYWFLSTLFMLLQQLWIMKKTTPNDGKGVVEGTLVE